MWGGSQRIPLCASANEESDSLVNNIPLTGTGGAAEECAKDYISDVRESSLWVSLRDCLSPADVLVLRTAGPKWYNAKLVDEFAELWFFINRKGVEEPPFALLPEWSSLCFEYRQNFGFDTEMFEPGRLPDLAVWGDSGEWT